MRWPNIGSQSPPAARSNPCARFSLNPCALHREHHMMNKHKHCIPNDGKTRSNTATIEMPAPYIILPCCTSSNCPVCWPSCIRHRRRPLHRPCSQPGPTIVTIFLNIVVRTTRAPQGDKDNDAETKRNDTGTIPETGGRH
jgi:hypothetical protein